MWCVDWDAGKKKTPFDFSYPWLFILAKHRREAVNCETGFHMTAGTIFLSSHSGGQFSLHDFTKKFCVMASPAGSQ